MYDRRFYDTIRPGCQASAAAVAPDLYDLIEPRTVVDVGCGEGWWGQAFADLGAAVVGLDTGQVAQPAPDVDLVDHDLAEQLPDIGPFDLAVCLEVAEHLPPSRADSFAADLCRLAPAVVFSAAVPGQSGTHHINCQWPAYWHDLFDRHGHACSWALRFEHWHDDRVEPWYRNNLMLATSQPDRFPALFATDLARPWPVLHPDLYITR